MNKNLFTGVVSIALAFLLAVALKEPCHNLLKESTAERNARDTAYAGEVVNKKIENARHSLFTSSDSEYRIYIKYEYALNDETKTGEKYFTVDKETYLAYGINDWFDSQNPNQ